MFRKRTFGTLTATRIQEPKKTLSGTGGCCRVLSPVSGCGERFRPCTASGFCNPRLGVNCFPSAGRCSGYDRRIHASAYGREILRQSQRFEYRFNFSLHLMVISPVHSLFAVALVSLPGGDDGADTLGRVVAGDGRIPDDASYGITRAALVFSRCFFSCSTYRVARDGYTASRLAAHDG